jgi:tetratricopeptide (TPR) repeat protein
MVFQGGDKDAANDFARVIEQLDPNEARAYLMRGKVYYAQEDYSRAMGDYNYAVDIDPELTPVIDPLLPERREALKKK